MLRSTLLRKALCCSALLSLLFVASAVVQSCAPKSETICNSISSFSVLLFNNGGEAPVAVTDGHVTARALKIEIDAVTEEKTCYNKRTWSMIPSAYAICYRPLVKRDEISTIEIYSDKKFDAQHEAGALLNDLFLVQDTAYAYYGNPDSRTKFYLLSAPDDTGTHVFNIKIALESGKELEANSPPVKLLK